MLNFFVTGGAGFIGSNFICRALELLNCRIINIDKLTYSGNLDNLSHLIDSPNYNFHQVDINNFDVIKSLMAKYKPDVLINFAAESHVDRSIDTPSLFIETNVLGTQNLLDASLDYWKDKNKDFKFIHISTDEVYGSLGDEGLFTEETAYSPSSPYSASKASSDHFVDAWHKTYGLPVIITNCSNNYGPMQFPEKLIPLMIINALSERKLPIYGDGKNIRDWIHVYDHCDAILSIIENGKIGEKYNIGGNCELQNIDIVNMICQKLDKKKRRKNEEPYSSLIEFVEDRPGHDYRYAIDSSKIHNELGWKPNISFEEGIEDTVDWYLENKQWWENIIKQRYNLERLGKAQ